MPHLSTVTPGVTLNLVTFFYSTKVCLSHNGRGEALDSVWMSWLSTCKRRRYEHKNAVGLLSLFLLILSQLLIVSTADWCPVTNSPLAPKHNTCTWCLWETVSSFFLGTVGEQWFEKHYRGGSTGSCPCLSRGEKPKTRFSSSYDLSKEPVSSCKYINTSMYCYKYTKDKVLR